MYNFLLMAHSGWRWIVLIVVVFMMVRVIVGWLAKQKWTNLESRLIRFTHIIVAFQILLGIILYIFFLINGGMGRSIGAFTGSHVVPAILAYGGVAFAAVRSKKMSDDVDKYKYASFGFIFAILMIYGALVTVGGIFA